MVSSLCTEFFVLKRGAEQTMSLLSKIEVFVKGAAGKYSCKWKDATEGHNVQLNIEVPHRSHVMEINQHLVKIEKIMNDDFSDYPLEGQQNPASSEAVAIEGDETLEGPCSSSQLLEGRESESKKFDKNQKKRSKHKCPYHHCKSSVVHLPRHMRKSHGWTPKKAKSVLSSFGLRKLKNEDVRKTKCSYKSVICPVLECQAVVKRLHNHLTSVHKMKPISKIYKKCLPRALRYDVDPIFSSESSTELSDASSSSSEFYKPPQKKMKDINVNRSDSVYNTVYGNSDEGSEGDVKEYEICEDENAHLVNTPAFDKKLRGIFDRYETWLRSADGGRKNDRSALQCRRQVELVVSYMDNVNQSLQCILDKNRLRDEWLVKFEKEKQPGAVKSYLGTLNNFFSFLKCENVDVGVSVDQLSSLAQQVKLWARSFRKNSMDRFWEKRMEDISTMRTPQQVKTFDNSEVARAAITLLGEYKDKEGEISPTQSEYTSVRDYLLTVLCINNGSRSGTLSNMTLREFKQATKEDDCFIVRVKDHKTFTTHGPVNLVFTSSLYSYTQIFIEKFRNNLEGVSTEGGSAVFLSVTLKKMTSSHVGCQIGSCWGKVFGKDTISGGAIAFRKAAVSAVNERNEDIGGDLANLMVHKQSTPDRYYLLQSKGKSAVRTSKELAKIMRSSGAEDNEPAENESKVLRRQSSEILSRRHKWTSAEIAELETAFSSNIDSQSVTVEQVRKTAKRIPALQGISPEKIRDKIRTYFGKSRGENSESLVLPEEKESLADRLKRAGLDKPRNDDGMLAEEITSQDELIIDEEGNVFNPNRESIHNDDGSGEEDRPSSEYAPSASLKKTMQSLLTMEEDEIFNSTFSKLIQSSKPIETKKVVAMIKKEAKLCHLLNSFTHRQMADKVRSLRKAYVLASSKKKLGKRPRN